MVCHKESLLLILAEPHTGKLTLYPSSYWPFTRKVTAHSAMTDNKTTYANFCTACQKTDIASLIQL